MTSKDLVDTVYIHKQESQCSNLVAGKSKVINKAIQDIGMGRYQWQLFVLCGFGWMAGKPKILLRWGTILLY